MLREGSGYGGLSYCAKEKRQTRNPRHIGRLIYRLTKYSQVQEQEKSDRNDTNLEKVASINSIHSEYNMMKSSLEYQFSRRQDLYRFHINLIDAILEMPNELQNEQIIRAIAENILQVYQGNPMLNIKDLRLCFGALHDEVYI